MTIHDLKQEYGTLTVVVRPPLKRITGSMTAAVFLAQSLFWQEHQSDDEGWFTKTREEWELVTAMTRYEQEGARKTLRELGFLEEMKAGLPALLYFRVCLEPVSEALTELAEREAEKKKQKVHQLGCRQVPTCEADKSPPNIKYLSKSTQTAHAPTPAPTHKHAHESKPVGSVDTLPETLPDGTKRLTSEQLKALEYAQSRIGQMALNPQTHREYRQLFAAGLTPGLLTMIVDETLQTTKTKVTGIKYFVPILEKALGQGVKVKPPPPAHPTLADFRAQKLAHEQEQAAHEERMRQVRERFEGVRDLPDDAPELQAWLGESATHQGALDLHRRRQRQAREAQGGAVGATR